MALEQNSDVEWLLLLRDFRWQEYRERVRPVITGVSDLCTITRTRGIKIQLCRSSRVDKAGALSYGFERECPIIPGCTPATFADSFIHYGVTR